MKSYQWFVTGAASLLVAVAIFGYFRWEKSRSVVRRVGWAQAPPTQVEVEPDESWEPKGRPLPPNLKGVPPVEAHVLGPPHTTRFVTEKALEEIAIMMVEEVRKEWSTENGRRFACLATYSDGTKCGVGRDLG